MADLNLDLDLKKMEIKVILFFTQRILQPESHSLILL